MPAGPAGTGGGRGAGPDGNAGGLRRGLVLRPGDRHHRHLPGLAGDERPHRRGAAGLGAAGGHRAAAVGSSGAPAAALRRQRTGAYTAPERARSCCAAARHTGQVAVLRAAGAARLRGSGAPAGAHSSACRRVLRPAQTLPWTRFVAWGWTSYIRLTGGPHAVARPRPLARRVPRPALALRATASSRSATRCLAQVIAVGILLPLTWLQQCRDRRRTSALVTGTVFGLVYAYVVHFAAVALQSVEHRLRPTAGEHRRNGAHARRAATAVFLELHAPLLPVGARHARLYSMIDVMEGLPAALLLRPFDSDTLAVAATSSPATGGSAENRAAFAPAIVAVGLIQCSCCRARIRPARLATKTRPAGTVTGPRRSVHAPKRCPACSTLLEAPGGPPPAWPRACGRTPRGRRRPSPRPGARRARPASTDARTGPAPLPRAARQPLEHTCGHGELVAAPAPCHCVDTAAPARRTAARRRGDEFVNATGAVEASTTNCPLPRRAVSRQAAY